MVLWDADHEGAFAWSFGLTAAARLARRRAGAAAELIAVVTDSTAYLPEAVAAERAFGWCRSRS